MKLLKSYKFDLVLHSPKTQFVHVYVEEYKTFYSTTLTKDGYAMPFILDLCLHKSKQFSDLNDISNYLFETLR